MKLGPRATFALVSALFFVTGMLGLGYELIWIRQATLVVGASQIALSTVLTAFFLGLALGSYLIGHVWKSRRIPPLVLYGFFEAGIGVYALLFPWLFRLTEAAYGALYPSFAGSSVALFGLRFALLLVLFLAPTVLMGGTLPVLLQGVVTGNAPVGARTSLLYGINILGAVAGVLLTSYLAIPGLGLALTSRVGGLLNLLIGATAIACFRRSSAPFPAAVEETAAPLGRFFSIAAFASGLLAIAYQVAWARYFTLFHTSTVYLTAVLLAVYLLALAAGSLLLAPALQARWNPLAVLAAVQALVPVVALWGLGWWHAADYRFALRGQATARGAVPLETLEIDPAYAGFWSFASETADTTFFVPLFQVALTLFIPVLLLGTGLPSLIAAAARGAPQLRSVSGRLIFWNTVGSSAGGFLGGYLLIPVLGLHWTMLSLGVGSLALSLAARLKALRGAGLPAAASRQERRRMEGAPGGPPRLRASGFLLQAVAVVAIAVFAVTTEDIARGTIQKYGYGRDPRLVQDAAAAAKGRAGAGPLLPEIVEGPLTTSFVFETDESVRIGSGNVCLAVASKKTPSTQAIQGHLPCILYPGSGFPKDCLGICLGSGQSFGALLLYPITRLDVVDISAEIVELSLERFAPYNHGLGTDPRVRFHLDDGRHFVERSGDGSYDVVSMEPPPPTADGVFSLYSLEFYEEVRRILRDGGVFMQWLPLYRVTPLDLRGLLRTQSEVFPETFVIRVGNDDFMIVSYKVRPVFPVAAIEERLKTLAGERLVAGLPWAKRSRHEIASLVGYLSSILTGPSDARDERGMVYRDDTQRLGYSSGDRWLLRRYEGPTLSRISFPALELTPFRDLAGYFDPPLSPALIEDLETERAESLATFLVPDPLELEPFRAAAAGAEDPRSRIQAALFVASKLDGMLRKEEAYSFVERAVEAMEAAKLAPLPEEIEHARKIVRNGLAPFEEVTTNWLERMERKAPGSALLTAMRGELRSYLEREEARKARYWLR
jgi:spermidine synthase